VNNNYNSKYTVVTQDFAVMKQVNGRAAHMTDTTWCQSWQSTPVPDHTGSIPEYSWSITPTQKNHYILGVITKLIVFVDHPRTVHSGTFISLTVSVSGIVLTAMSSGEMISKHDMQGISFASGGEKVSASNSHFVLGIS
jgi:hypothetical protein